jgi:hypothetical protein
MHLSKSTFLSCLMSLAMVGSAASASASVTRLGASFSAIVAAARGSSVAYDSINHDYLVVSTYGMLNGRVLAEDGTPLTPQFVIQASGNFTHFPRVAFSPDANGGQGGFLVTWHESDLAGGATSIHARVVSSAGSLLSGDTQIAADGSWWEAGAPVAYATVSREFLVAWRCLTNNDIHAIRISNAGTPLSGVFSITQTPIYEDNPSIAYNPSTDEFLVGYAGYNDPALYAFVSAQRVKAGTGALVGPATVLTTAAGTYITDTAFSAATGKFVVAWYQPGGAYAQQVDANGNAVGSVTLLSSRYSAYDALSLAFNPISNTFLMVSHDQGGTVEDGAVELDGSGAPLDGGQLITAAGGTGNFYPRVAANTRLKNWLVSSAHSFTSTIGQLAATDSSGASTAGPAPLVVNSIGVSPAGPYSAGTTITLTGNTSGGTGPLTYQFWVNDGSGWVVKQAYSATSTYTFAPPSGTYAIQVWVRNAGSTATYDGWAGTSITVTAPQARFTSFTVNQTFPLAPNIAITWTAAATAGSSAVEYKWWRFSEDTGWSVALDWSATNTFTWFPVSGVHAVQVWTRRVGSTAAYEDWRGSGNFSIASTPAHMVSLSANATFPASPSRTITWTAVASGGNGPIEYKFWLYLSSTASWVVLSDWSSSAQASWTPGVANTGQNALQVWVRTVGNTASYEDWSGTGYFLITDSTALTLTPNRSLASLASGASVSFTAAMAGGGGPYEYQFWTYDATTGAWTVSQAYSASATFTWSNISRGTHALQVWARAIGSGGVWERWQPTGLFIVN